MSRIVIPGPFGIFRKIYVKERIKAGNFKFVSAFEKWAKENGVAAAHCEYRMIKKQRLFFVEKFKTAAVKTTDPQVGKLIDDGYAIQHVTDESGKVVFTPEDAMKYFPPSPICY